MRSPFSLREKDTSARMREVEQRTEQLPRMRGVDNGKVSDPLTPTLSGGRGGFKKYPKKLI